MIGAAFGGCRPLAGLLVSVLWGGGPRVATAQEPARTHVLIVTGASGEPQFAQQFHALAMSMRTTVTGKFGVPDSQVIYLAEQTTPDPRSISGRSNKEGVIQAIDRIKARAKAGDAVLIMLIGHGTSDGDVSRFNVPGADMSDADFKIQLDKLSNQSVAFVNAASASGDFVKTVSAKNRVVVTATKSGFEKNETMFAEHFITAYAKEGADTDKGGRDGALASTVFIQSAAGLNASAGSDPRAVALLATQAKLESQLDSLRLAKGIMSDAEYQKALEDLLLKISENASALRALGVRKP